MYYSEVPDLKVKSTRSKEYKKEGEKIYIKYKNNILIEKKLEKAFQGKKKRKQKLRTFEEMDNSGSNKVIQSLDDSDTSLESNNS